MTFFCKSHIVLHFIRLANKWFCIYMIQCESWVFFADEYKYRWTLIYFDDLIGIYQTYKFAKQEFLVPYVPVFILHFMKTIHHGLKMFAKSQSLNTKKEKEIRTTWYVWLYNACFQHGNLSVAEFSDAFFIATHLSVSYPAAVIIHHWTIAIASWFHFV